MLKFLPALFILTAQAVLAQDHGVGALCETFVGTIPCDAGLNCCNVFPDFGVCYDGECPKKLLTEGELCNGFAGPTGTCLPGLQCCYVSPDNSVCAAKCSSA